MIRRLLISALLLAVLPLGTARAQNTSDFTIESFEADYYISRDVAKTSHMRVHEVITARFPDFDQNHGILRALPKSYQNHTVSLKIDSVKDATGAAWPYATYEENDNEVLKIGDANKFVHGLQTYVIDYSLRNVISFQDYDELFWDVNGDQWQQPFSSVTARIHIPSDLSSRLETRQRCFTGIAGSKAAKCLISRTTANEETVVTVATQNLKSRENLTFVLGFTRDTFAMGPEVVRERAQQLLVIILVIGGITLPPLLAFGVMFHRWRKFGRDPRGRGVIVPEYQPPKGLNALVSYALLEETVRSNAVSALVIELAIKRYITIYEVDKKKLLGSQKHYELELVKSPADLSVEERSVVEALFGADTLNTRINLDDKKNKLGAKLKTLNEQANKRLHNLGYFREDPGKVRSKYTLRGGLLIVVGIAISFFGVTIPLTIGLVLAGIITMLFGHVMPVKSEQGVVVRDTLLGLRGYIKLAEAERLKFHQSPEGALKTGASPQDPRQKVKLFEQLLPYAMLFGLEKNWAKQFEHLYTKPPEWYHGNWAAFSTVHLASSLGSFSTSSAAAFTAPSSSGSSGFSGGGSSGGGGGGGGGGGW